MKKVGYSDCQSTNKSGASAFFNQRKGKAENRIEDTPHSEGSSADY